MEPLKNLYSKNFFDLLCKVFLNAYPNFQTDQFQKLIYDEHWDSKELKQRTRHITVSINQTLQLDYLKTLEILKRVAVKFQGFTATIFPDYVEVYGINHYEESIPALELFTQYSSSEFAIRPFIKKYPEAMMRQMLEWSKHENHHVRRLASEGCRPRLPWAMALPDFKRDPSSILPILENLKEDNSEYVRRSVANNLNDIGKDHPHLVLELANKWKAKNANTDWIIRHACRSLLKKGNTIALSIFGFNEVDSIFIDNFKLSKESIGLGDNLIFSFSLAIKQSSDLKLRLEYAIYYMKANGKLSKKVFKLAENTFSSSRSFNFSKSHSFKNLTTRKHYAGLHKLSLIINGKEMEKKSFDLTINLLPRNAKLDTTDLLSIAPL